MKSGKGVTQQRCQLFSVFSDSFDFAFLPFSRWKFFAIQEEKFLFLQKMSNIAIHKKKKSVQWLYIPMHIYTDILYRILLHPYFIDLPSSEFEPRYSPLANKCSVPCTYLAISNDLAISRNKTSSTKI